MILFPLSTRLRRAAIACCGIAALAACRGGVRQAAGPPARQGAQFHIAVANASGSAERVEVMLDGTVVLDAQVAGRSKNTAVAVPVTPGWHRIETRTSGGGRHRAMVEGDRTKWIRVQREPRKPEGVGVHITEYPQ